MSSFRFFQPPKGSPPSVFTSSVQSLAGYNTPSAPSGPEVSIPLDPKKQRTKERRKLFDLVMGKAKEGDLSFGEYRDLQSREREGVVRRPNITKGSGVRFLGGPYVGRFGTILERGRTD